MAGRMVVGSAALAGLVRPASEATPDGAHRVLPVLPELTGLLPGRGLRRGSTVAVAAGQPASGGGTSSLMLALLAEASRSGSWCAVVGVPAFGAVAAADLGIALDRLALVPHPGPEWATVVAALIDGVDVVVTAVPGTVSASVASRLAARARQRGSVLVPYGRWDGADVTLRVMRGTWEGLGPGRGRLRRREVTISARGRGAAARPKEVKVWMPGDGVARPTGSSAVATVGGPHEHPRSVAPGAAPRRPVLTLVGGSTATGTGAGGSTATGTGGGGSAAAGSSAAAGTGRRTAGNGRDLTAGEAGPSQDLDRGATP